MNSPEKLFKINIPLFAESDTIRLAHTFAAKAIKGTTILLNGEVGTGKTVFARNLIQKLLMKYGLNEDVPSPTYTLIQSYQTPEIDITHADLYRIKSKTELMELGLTDAFENSLCLIEWPDKLDLLIPRDAVKIKLEYGNKENSRICTIECHDKKKYGFLRLIQQELKTHDRT